MDDGSDSLESLLETIGQERADALQHAASDLRALLAGRDLWHVSSTAEGGGVAELLSRVLPIYRALGISVRWAVINGPGAFFETTKALGLALYGDGSMLGTLDEQHKEMYAEHGAKLASAFLELAGSSPAVVLHDHQTVGLAPALRARDVHALIWRRHVGVDEANQASSRAEDFLALFGANVDARVFSIPGHITGSAPGILDVVIPPVIDPSAPKHVSLDAERYRELQRQLSEMLVAQTSASQAKEVFRWQSPLAVQVSRWDRLKDMHGVIIDFVESCPNGALILAGPDPHSIRDDPEQPKWFDKAQITWRNLPEDQRNRVALLRLPMDDVGHNALLVNALQRTADVVIQKSLAEGFGLTVTEAMWKSKAVVGSDVGGIREQVQDGESGLLAPAGASIGPAVRQALDNGDLRVQLGTAAHLRVKKHYLADTDVIRTAQAIRTVLERKEKQCPALERKEKQ